MSAPPLRLLMSTDAIGGVWTYSLELARALRAHGIHTTLAVIGPALWPSQQEAADAAGVPVISTGLPLDWLASTPEEVRTAADEFASISRRAHFDLVQLNAPALAIGRGYAAPLVAVCHSCLASWWESVRGGALPEDFAWRDALLKQALRLADKVIVPTAALAEQMLRLHTLSTPPEVVHNGRRPLEVVTGPRGASVFTAGRLWDEGKNLAVIDEMAQRLRVPVRAAGPTCGPQGQTARLPHLELQGMLDDRALAARLADQPIFVSAARYEPFGLAVLEAAQAGCALVLSDIPSFRELWEDAAFFVPPDSSSGFTRAVETLLAEEDLRAHLGRSARERARRYTVEAMASRMGTLYRDVLRDSGDRGHAA